MTPEDFFLPLPRLLELEKYVYYCLWESSEDWRETETMVLAVPLGAFRGLLSESCLMVPPIGYELVD